jgi:putative glutamine amidotransferase
MAGRPRVGVTGDHRRWAPSWWCLKLGLLLLRARPQRISVRSPATDEDFDALIVSGGNDIGPELYGETAQPHARIDPQRDRLEIAWVRRALQSGVPILGICRGAQLLNVVLGGSLITDLRPVRRLTSNRASILATKQVKLRRASRLRQLLDRDQLRVNSLHHQAVGRPGEGLRIVARDRDGICQAIEHGDGHRILGVQWHPEYLLYLSSQRRLLAWLLHQARQGAPEADTPGAGATTSAQAGGEGEVAS